jgi:hypothetical protein
MNMLRLLLSVAPDRIGSRKDFHNLLNRPGHDGMLLQCPPNPPLPISCHGALVPFGLDPLCDK